jgi:prepilin-type N-terminal cleavage/methylation domain-containing protein
MTLIELVVVIALIGIMAGVAAPNLASFDQRYNDRSGSALVDDLLRFGRKLAVDRGAPVDLTLDPETGRYWIDPPDSSAVLSLPEGVTLVSSAARVHVRFDPNGEMGADAELAIRRGETTSAILAPR